MTNTRSLMMFHSNDFIESYIKILKLRKSGKNYRGKCPACDKNALSLISKNGRVIGQCFACGIKTKEIREIVGIKSIRPPT